MGQTEREKILTSYVRRRWCCWPMPLTWNGRHIIMSRHKKSTEPVRLKLLATPYQEQEDDHIDLQWRRYLADPAHTIMRRGLMFYRIIHAYTFTRGHTTRIMAVLDEAMALRTGDALTDEEGRLFRVAGFEFFRYVSPMPECAGKIASVLLDRLDGPPEIGAYLAKTELPGGTDGTAESPHRREHDV